MTLSNESVVALTGAGSGIGRALTLELVKEGVAGIAISDVNQANLLETEALAAAIGGKVLAVTADVSKYEDVERFKTRILEEFGKVTHLINNAGVGLVGRTEEISIADMEWLMGVNFWGTVYGSKIFLPEFRRENAGHIINISSVFGFISPPGQSAYCASKFAVRGFTEVLRHELEGSGIFVSCVHPGGIYTNIAKDARKGENTSESDLKLAGVLLEKLARTTAETAAQVIVKGIKSKNPRILIGNDARQISAIQRLFPKRYFKVMDRMTGGLLSKYR